VLTPPSVPLHFRNRVDCNLGTSEIFRKDSPHDERIALLGYGPDVANPLGCPCTPLAERLRSELYTARMNRTPRLLSGSDPPRRAGVMRNNLDDPPTWVFRPRIEFSVHKESTKLIRFRACCAMNSFVCYKKITCQAAREGRARKAFV